MQSTPYGSLSGQGLCNICRRVLIAHADLRALAHKLSRKRPDQLLSSQRANLDRIKLELKVARSDDCVCGHNIK